MPTNVDPQPPDSVLNDSENTQSKLDSHIATKNSIHASNQHNVNKNTSGNTTENSAKKIPESDVLMAKSPESVKDNDDDTKPDRTLQLATTSVIVNKRITTPVTLELRPTHGSSNLNVAKAHRNIFIAMKMKDPTLKLISNETVIDTELQFPEGNDYTNVFTKIIKCPKTSRVYISHKIESAKSIAELKYGNNKEMTNIFDTLIANGAYLTHNKFQSHKEHAIGFFVNINPRVTLRDELRARLQEVLMWIDIEDKECQQMIHEVKDKDGNPTGKQKIVIPAFDLYSKEVGEGQGYDRITTLAYEIRTSPENAIMLKSLLCQVSSAKVLDLKFVPYGLDRQTNERTIREIIIQQNIYLAEMAIVPVTGITKDDKEEVETILSRSLYITGIEATRKSKEDGRYLLLTTNANKANAQREVDNLLGKYYKKNTNKNGSTQPPGHRQAPSTSTHFSTYAAALLTSHPSTNIIPDRKRPSQLNNRPVTISFSSPSPTFNPYSQQFSTGYPPTPNQQFNKNYHESPNLKRKLSNDTTSIVSLNTHTTTESTTETQSTWKEDLTKLVQDNNSKMEKKLEKSNEETQKTIKDSVNKTLKDFQATVIESVQEMITIQIDKSNKHMMAGVQEMITKQAEASNKFMMEAIQQAMQVSTIHQQQLNTITLPPSYNTTISNLANNDHQHSPPNNFTATTNLSQNEVNTSTTPTQAQSNHPPSDTQLITTNISSTINDDDLHWEDMYDTDDESDNNNMEGLEILSTDEDKTTNNNTNNKRSKGTHKKKRSPSKAHASNIKKPQTRLSKKHL